MTRLPAQPSQSATAVAWRYAIVTATDPGRKRSNNEDAVGADVENVVAVLADGMGGYAAGEVASQWAVYQFLAGVPPLLTQAGAFADSLRTLAQQVNQEILDQATNNPDLAGMGSTVVVAVGMGDTLVVGHLGDSRAYRFRAHALSQLTRDHSWVDEQVAMGLLMPEQAQNNQHTNMITRALGIEEEVDMEVHAHPVQSGDLYLLCSDGVTDMLSDADIASILQTADSAELALVAQTLIDRANAAGGKDNIGVVLISANDA